MTEQKRTRRTTKSQPVAKEQNLDLTALPDITPFVTNPDGNVYAVTNLTEEFIAVLFAWVSRSPKSFKEHLLKAIQDGLINASDYQGKDSFEKLSKKAQDFHEKWTVSYGHSSVAEHANAHVGIEKVSRLASAELELSNTFYSITEYSQRYQKPQRGDWHNPVPKSMPNPNGITRDMVPNPLWQEFEDFMNECYDVFEQLIDGVYKHLKEADDKLFHPSSGTANIKRDNEIMKLAFEDARYALPLAMHTQLGMTANGRTWRDGIATLYSSSYPEVIKLAGDLKTEITKVLPTLLKHAVPSQYKVNSKQRIKHRFADQPSATKVSNLATLIKGPSPKKAIETIIAEAIVQENGIPYEEAMRRAENISNPTEIIKEMLFEIGKHDTPPESFRGIDFSFELLVSEANWHQLLRHNRKTDFIYNQPSPYNGVTIPPRIAEAGLQGLLFDLAEKAETLYEKLLGTVGHEYTAPYIVLNTHRRRIVAHFDLWEAYHLINLRTSEEAQWDIRETFEEVYRQLHLLYPDLIDQAKRR
ncbi:FAD-dependent thymidylate synthase (plasmid) [Paenibacillus urinalis]|uniref:FAD-dependent thymidylate synthase n=1 Tax=Paenibacillus urinalis TaxID=521520 RepID=A0ABY7XHP6_9BACL|nr:FAD-dependent thymidylate synthase [Paenibacillus urinalis]WDI05229.1 FAD-dependent thymidylate synthase [Paenibacillus urinalis]